MKKKYWKFSAKGLSYFWDLSCRRFKIFRNISGRSVSTDWPSCIDDVNWFMVPVSRTRKPKKKKSYRLYN